MCTKWGICKPIPAPVINNGPEVLEDVRNGTTMQVCPTPSNTSPAVDDINYFNEDKSENSSNQENLPSSQKMHRWIKTSRLANLLSKSSLGFTRIDNRSQNENRRQIYALSDRTFASSLNEFAVEDKENENAYSKSMENGTEVTTHQNQLFPLNFSRKSLSLNNLSHEVKTSAHFSE